MRVLIIHPVSVFGGATKSLCELLSAFTPGAVDAVAIAPVGHAASALTAMGVSIIEVRGITQWDNTLYGHYRAWRWMILLREAMFLPGTVVALLRSRSHRPFGLIHCNEISALPAGILAKWLHGSPLLVHVRSVQRTESSSLTSRAVMWAVRRYADRLVAIDSAVRRSLPADIPVDVIHNGLRVPSAIRPQSEASGENSVFTIGVIGVLIRAKGVMELVDAVRRLRDRGLSVRLLVAGENPRKTQGLRGWMLRKFNLSHDVRAELESYIQEHHLSDSVQFLGFVSDIGSFYRKLDLLCFPSHLDAPGRPVFEAALHGLPAIVAMRNPTSDVVEHGVTGLCIPESDPALIADAIAHLATNKLLTRKMGEAAFARAVSRFDSRVCAEKFMNVYEALSRAGSK